MTPARMAAVPALFALASVAAHAGSLWDHDLAARLREEARQTPGQVLLLRPAERLRYQIRSVGHPPRIPFFSSGAPRIAEFDVEVVAVGLDAEGYDLAFLIEEDNGHRFRTRARVDHRGRLLADEGPRRDAMVENILRIFQNLAITADPRPVFCRPSRLGVTQIETEARYQPRPDRNGSQALGLSFQETEGTRGQGFGYRAEGEVLLDAAGLPVEICTRGYLWKRGFLGEIRVGVEYEAHRVEALASRL